MNERESTLREFHEDRSRHGGIDDTMYNIKDLWFPDMKKEIERYVKECIICQRRKVEKQLPTGEMHSFEVYKPHSQIAIDVMGPLSNSISDQNTHVIDMSTRWIDAKAVSAIDKTSFAKYLTEYCGRYGVPEVILTDNALNFCNSLIVELTKVYEITHITTTPYHPRANAREFCKAYRKN